MAILNYNGPALLEQLLPTLAVKTSNPVRMIVVDNCSTDDSVAFLRERWPLSPALGVGAGGDARRA